MLSPTIDSFDAMIWLAIAIVSGTFSALAVAMIAHRRWKAALERAVEAMRAVEARIMIENGRLLAADDVFADLTGRRRGDLLGRPVTAFLPGLTDAQLVLAANRPVETTLIPATGAERTVSLAACPVDGNPDGWLLVVQCHNSAAAMEERVAFLSRHDSLTGLANMPTFIEEGSERLIAAAEGGRRIALAQIDLVRFRAINDVMGRRFGDRALVEVARRLREAASADTLL